MLCLTLGRSRDMNSIPAPEILPGASRRGAPLRSPSWRGVCRRAAGRAAMLLWAAAALAAGPAQNAHRPPTAAEVLAASTAADWRALDPQNTLYLELPAGRVVIELMPQFAPNHVANVLALTRGRYFDGLAIVRSQDNYVVQWGDPAGNKKPVGTAHRTLAAEFERPLRGVSLTRLPDVDTYAAEA